MSKISHEGPVGGAGLVKKLGGVTTLRTANVLYRTGRTNGSSSAPAIQKTGIDKKPQHRPTQAETPSKRAPLKETNTVNENSVRAPPPKSTPVAKKMSTVKRWKIPAHKGVPVVITKSPAVTKGITKPKSTIKRKKLPAHSGVPISFGKKTVLKFSLSD